MKNITEEHLQEFVPLVTILIGRNGETIIMDEDMRKAGTLDEAIEAARKLLPAIRVGASPITMAEDASRLITAREGAAMFRVSRFTFDKWAKSDGFPKAFKVGMVKRWIVGDLKAWFDDKRRTS